MNNTISKGIVSLVIIVTMITYLGMWYWRNNSMASERCDHAAETAQEVSKLPTDVQSLFFSLRNGNVTETTKILKSHPDLLEFDFGSEGTPLHVAARYNKPALIAVLLDLGANIRSRGQWDGTPLHWAAWWGSADSLSMLLDRGASPEIRGDSFGSTPLLWACHGSTNANCSEGDYLRCVQLLLDAGAQPDTTNCEGTSAISMASPAIADLLKSRYTPPALTIPAASMTKRSMQVL